MPKYVIERDIPQIGNVTPDQVIAISQKSCSVLNTLGPKIQWLHSYVTQDKIYCVYIAPNEEMVKEHARQGERQRQPDDRGHSRQRRRQLRHHRGPRFAQRRRRRSGDDWGPRTGRHRGDGARSGGGG